MGALVFAVGDGPYRSSPGAALRLNAKDLRTLLQTLRLRASVGGYLGHMWELYAFWAVVPILCAAIVNAMYTGVPHGAIIKSDPRGAGLGLMYWLIAIVVAIGAASCLLGGYASNWTGSVRVAFIALAGSGLICLVYPLVPPSAVTFKVVLLLLWGVPVVADSPQFLAMSSQAAPPALLGLALVLQNGMGFVISAISIVLLSKAMQYWGEGASWLLVPGPVLGLWVMRSLLRSGTGFSE